MSSDTLSSQTGAHVGTDFPDVRALHPLAWLVTYPSAPAHLFGSAPRSACGRAHRSGGTVAAEDGRATCPTCVGTAAQRCPACGRGAMISGGVVRAHYLGSPIPCTGTGSAPVFMPAMPGRVAR
jgi:hypothetical protein